MSEKIEFLGIIFTRYKNENYYSSPSKKRLHVAIWENKNGKLTEKGFVIHHKDFNPLNNNPDNLEILTHSEHRKIHFAAKSKQEKDTQILILKNANEKSKAWHKSESGSIHREKMNQRRIQKNKRKENSSHCVFCGKLFYHAQKKAKYCSGICFQREARIKNNHEKYIVGLS